MKSKLSAKIPKKVPKNNSPLGKMNSGDTASVLTQLINAKKEYEMCIEQETTKRQAIESDLKKYMADIQLKRDVIFSVLENQYKMRSDSINKMYELLDTAYADGRDEVVIQALTSIEGIIKESPAKELLTIREAFTNPNVDLVI